MRTRAVPLLVLVALGLLLAVGRDAAFPFADAPATPVAERSDPDTDGIGPAVPGEAGGSEADEEAEEARERVTPRPRGLPAGSMDPLVATSGGAASIAGAAMPATTTSWDGLGDGFTGYPVGVFAAPPDPALDVGRTQVVEAVNHAYAVWSKSGTLLLAPRAVRSLWSGFGGLCETNADGDPTVTYDRLADRWVVMQLAYNGADGKTVPFKLCVAVSQTADATGAWYRYSFDHAVLPDYPKLSVWPDAYFLTFNGYRKSGSGWSWDAAQVCGLDRARMLAGLSSARQCWSLPTSYSSPLVATVEGRSPPPAGRAAYLLALGGTGKLDTWRLSLDWTTASNSRFTGPTSVAVSDYALGCAGACIAQPGTGQALESEGDRLMHRVVYRNLGTREMIVAAHTVSSGGANAIRWYELRGGVPGADPALVQQGTHAPDGDHRWLPAVATNHRGDLAILQTAGSGTLFPSIRISGRLVEDTAGTLGQGEATLVAGTGSQTVLSRWGDYASLASDPNDDCTFWGASQYQATTGSYNWRTRIVSFSYPACMAASPRLSASTTGDGAGRITSAPAGLVCPGACSVGLGWGTRVELTAEASPGSRFTGWSGACGGTGTCVVNMDASQGVSAQFVKVPTPVITPPPSPVLPTALTYTLSSSDGMSDLTTGDLVIRGTAPGCGVTGVTSTKRGGTAWSVIVGGCSDGTVVLSLRALSVVGPTGTRGPDAETTAGTVLVDGSAPVVGSPVVSTASVAAGGAVAVNVAASDGSGVKAAAANVGGGAWTGLASAGFGGTPIVAAGSLTAPATAGSYTVCARATDLLDHTSGSVCGPLVVGTLTTLTFIGSADVSAGSTRAYSARLTAVGTLTPISGRTVSFTFVVGTKQTVLSAMTNSSGDATVIWVAPTSPSTVPLTLSHVASPLVAASSTQVSLVVRTPTVLTYSGVTSFAAGSSITLTASLRTAGGSAVSGQAVTFTLTGTGYSASSTRTTSSTGVASWAITAPMAGSYTLSLAFAGTGSFQPSSASAGLTAR